ncbi:MAG: magnesium transporter [Bacteroidia bacterium]|nr:magnesium transporter [Bacteroidia bacterium]
MAKTRSREEDRVERVQRLLKSPNARIQALMGVLHPTEIAQVLEDTPHDTRRKIISQLPPEVLSEAISEMDEDSYPGQLLLLLNPEVAAEILKELDFDDGADLLSQLPEHQQNAIMKYLPDEEEDVLNQLLKYDEDTAGGLMNPEVVSVRENTSKLEALKDVVSQSEEMEEFYTIYVTDDESILKGYLTLRGLFVARGTELIRNIMSTDIVSVAVDMDQEEVAKLMSQYNLPTLPVVDHDGKLLGRVTFDDVMDVIEEESTEDLLNFAGVSDEENLRGGWADAVKSRIPWLLINLVTASIAAFTISNFSDTINKLVLLTTLMPIIAGVSGNGATQTLAVTIRRISTDGIPTRKAFGVVLKELSVGGMNGLMLGAVVSIAISLIYSDLRPEFIAMLGLVVFLAMFGNLMLAGFAGSIIPITLERLGVDPAVASSILITAFTDIIGYLLLFGLASKILLPLVSSVHEIGSYFLDPLLIP